jgi:3-hydroxybutyryl-CoA dehydratase
MARTVSRSWKVVMEDVGSFTRVVGDYNAVHRDADFAAKTRFKRPIAHGMTAIAMLNHMLPPTLTLSHFQIRFLKPIFPGETINAHLAVDEVGGFELKLAKDGLDVTAVKGMVEELA